MPGTSFKLHSHFPQRNLVATARIGFVFTTNHQQAKVITTLGAISVAAVGHTDSRHIAVRLSVKENDK